MLLGRLKYTVTLVDGSDCHFDPIAREMQAGLDLLIQWLEYGCANASTDKELAVLLRDHTLQYPYRFSMAEENIATIGLKYIKVSFQYR